MKRKLLSLIFMFGLIVPAMFCLSACKDETPPTEPTPNTYVVQFYNYNGSFIKEIEVEENSAATCETPTKESTQYYVYEFAYWELLDGTNATEQLANVTTNLTVRATFIEVQPSYTISFYDEDKQTLLDTISVPKGEDGTFIENPTKESDEFYDYAFVAWEDINGEVVESLTNVQNNFNLFAKFEISNQHTFTVNFYDEDKTTLLNTQKVVKGQKATCEALKDIADTNYAYCLDYWTDIEGNEIGTSNIQAQTNFYAKYSKDIFDKAYQTTYIISQDETYYCLRKASKEVAEVVIPSEINSISVTEIYSNVFRECKTLTKIEIPSTILRISHDAFYQCTGLECIEYLGDVDSWASIEFYFESSNPLFYSKRATLKINGQVLTHANITKATEVKQYAFIYCTSLKQLTLGSSVTTIGERAFDACELISVTVNPSVKSFGYRAFDFHYNIWEGGTIEVVDYLGSLDEWMAIDFAGGSNPLSHGAVLKVNGKIVTNININTTDFDTLAFMGCSSLTDVVFGENVTTIGDWAFNHCWGLTSVTIGSGLRSIGTSAFGDCPSLTAIIIDSPTIANELDGEYENGCLVQKAKTIYIKSGLITTNSTYLLENFTKQETSDKDGYDKYVRNAQA